MLAKRLNKKVPNVVIFGRTNVGKSTLFNKLTESRQALMSRIEGTTRDSNIGQVNWQGKSFSLIDTGGLMDLKYLKKAKTEAKTIDELVQKQARQFLTRADLVLFLVDNKDGLLMQDKEMSALLKKFMPELKKIILVANKVDNHKQASAASEFYQLNLGKPQTISATTGAGTGDLLDLIIKKLKQSKMPAIDTKEKEKDIVKVCILGKPNVGKSSLLNSILGYERVIVSPIPHTTREPQDTDIDYKGKTIKLIDTAGISRKGKKSKDLEKLGILKSLDILNQADIALLVIDISKDITQQDAKLVEEVFNRYKSLVIVANKWDLIKPRDTKGYTQKIYKHFPFATFVPIQFMSAEFHTKINRLMDLILKINEMRHLELSEAQLDRFIKECVKKHRPTKGKGTKKPRIFKFKQTGSNPLEFAIKIGSKENLAETYLHFLSNQLRDKFKIVGTPINIWVEKSKHVHGRHNN
ncbi:MAG: ribosome biogenesis GTPase Der [bacterium]